jgi:hypothetical protein
LEPDKLNVYGHTLVNISKLGKPKRNWDNNIKMYLRAIGWVDIYCVDLVQDGN